MSEFKINKNFISEWYVVSGRVLGFICFNTKIKKSCYRYALLIIVLYDLNGVYNTWVVIQENDIVHGPQKIFFTNCLDFSIKFSNV